MTPRRVLLVCILIVQLACAMNQPPQVDPPVAPAPIRIMLPLGVPDEAIFCVQTRPLGEWKCGLTVGDLRKLLPTIQKATEPI